MGSITNTKKGSSAPKELSPRLQELEAQFLASGGQYKEYKLGDLFVKIQPKMQIKNKKYKVSDLPKAPTDECNLPMITACGTNQGISCFAPKNDFTVLKNIISLSANGMPVCFYQPREFGILQDAYAIAYKKANLKNNQADLQKQADKKKKERQREWN